MDPHFSYLIFCLALELDSGEGIDPALSKALWDEHQYLLALLVYKLGDDDLAQDILQETYLAFLRSGSRPRFSDAKKLRNYLVTIALNKIRDYYRSAASPSRRLCFRTEEEADAWLASLPSGEAGPAEGLERELEDRRRQALVALAMEALPQQQRLVLELKFTQGLDNPQAAARMGIGIKALESLLFRAKAAFKKEFIKAGQSANESASRIVPFTGGGVDA